MAPLPSTGCQLYRRENDSIAIPCLAVGWLPRHPLTASPWKDFIAIRCRTVTWLLCHLLDACCITVLSPDLRKENPRGENPMGRLSLSAGHWLIQRCLTSRLFCTLPETLSVSFSRMYEKALVVSYTGKFYLFLPRGPVVDWAFNWHVMSEASQVAYR